MKKFLVLLLMFVSITAPVFASNWVRLKTENDKAYYLNQAYTRNGKIVYCKLKQVPLWEGENRAMFSLKIDYNRGIVYAQYTRYNANGVAVSSSAMPPIRFSQMNPDSALASAVVKIAKYYGF